MFHNIKQNSSPLFLAIISILLILSSALYGKNAGMNHYFDTPLDTRAQQMAAAITDHVYRLNGRYTAHSQVYETLLRNGMSDVPDLYTPLGLKSPPYSDANFWNNLILKASSLHPLTSPRYSSGTLSFVNLEDMGIVNFYKLSFSLFGLNIEGFYKLFFVLLLISVIFIYVTFWRQIGILFSVNLILVGLFISICSINIPGALSTVSNGRFLNTLAVIPAFHLAVILWRPLNTKFLIVLSTIFQSLFLAFVILMRSNAIWAVIFLGLSALVLIFYRIKPILSSAPFFKLVRNMLTWPMLTIFLSLASVNLIYKANLHPAYTLMDELLPHHYFWHSLAYGIGLNNPEKVMPEINGARGDSIGYKMAALYMKKEMGIEYQPDHIYFSSPLFPQLGRPQSYERMAKAAVIDFYKNHPTYFLKLTFIVKPSLTFNMYKDAFIKIIKNNYLYLISLLVPLLIIFLYFSKKIEFLKQFKFSLLIITGLMIFSLLPAIIAYPSLLSSADTVALIFSIGVGLALLSINYIVSFLMPKKKLKAKN